MIQGFLNQTLLQVIQLAAGRRLLLNSCDQPSIQLRIVCFNPARGIPPISRSGPTPNDHEHGRSEAKHPDDGQCQ